MRKIFIAIGLCLLLASQAAADFSPDAAFKKVWSDIASLAENAKDVAADPARNSTSILQSLLGQGSRYASVLRRARDVLGESAATSVLDDLDSVRRKLDLLNKRASELRHRRVTAPVSSVNPFAETRSSIDRKLEVEIPRERQMLEKEAVQLKEEAIRKFAEAGIRVTNEQLDYFLVSAEGEELAKLMGMAANMKLMQAALEEQMEASRQDLDLAVRYAGMHLVCLDAYAMAHEVAIENIGKYKERLSPIAEEAARSTREAEELMREARPEERRSLEANIRINMRTASVAEAYGRILEKRAKALEASLAAVRRRADVARNAYATMRNGGELVAMVRKGSDEYDMIMDFRMPELKAIYEPAMMDAFTEISARIKK